MKIKPKCCECGKGTLRIHPILNVHLCSDCQRWNQEKYRYITKTRAMGEYRLRPADLASLRTHQVDNPYYKSSAPMQLYLFSQVQELAKTKWGSAEPYTVALTMFSEEHIAWLLEDLERLKQFSPEKFQFFIADRMENMGLSVQMVGDVYRKDGGIDIIAYPNRCAMPFLLAIQVKHHHLERKTPVRYVRDLHGAISSQGSPFRLGMVVTNTSFTPDAKWFGSHNQMLLRLRDLQDLRRWLKNDFVNEHEWREIPDEIELAPGVNIKIAKQRIWLPSE